MALAKRTSPRKLAYMRASGVFGVVFALLGITAACGGDDAPPQSGGGGDGGSSPGAAGAPGPGAAGEPGPGPGSSGAGPMVQGGEGGTDSTSGGQGGAIGVGGNYDPEDPNPVDPAPITFTVVAGEGRRPISPLIYGANMDGLSCADSRARFTFCRHRSAAWSTYNWENNASNAGVNGCNENNDALSTSDVPGAAITQLIDQATGVGASTIVTVPMLERVAADKQGGGASCDGDVTNSDDYLTTRFKQSRLNKGSALSLTPDTTDDFVNVDELLAFLGDYREKEETTPLLFALDNQMELWNVEHPRVRTTPLTYAEGVQLSIDYAATIKDTVPDAEVLGFVGYGYLAARNLQSSPDYASEGEYWSYYLRELAAADEAAGKRLIDYVDLHWFSEIYGNGIRVIEEDTTFDSVLARVQGPRSFWDPSYDEGSWITAATGEPIQLFDWLKAGIDEHYPGTKLALAEWSFGGGTHISGAVVTADALGLFGQKGIDLAGVVSFSPADEPYLIGAFQAFRNYDGEGGQFGDTSVSATSTNPHHGTIYASIDEADPSRMVLVAINRRAGDLMTSLTIEHDQAYTKLTPYKISEGQPEPTLDDEIEATEPNSFELVIPGYSVWVLVPGE